MVGRTTVGIWRLPATVAMNLKGQKPKLLILKLKNYCRYLILGLIGEPLTSSGEMEAPVVHSNGDSDRPKLARFCLRLARAPDLFPTDE